jgi:hypothetical protein
MLVILFDVTSIESYEVARSIMFESLNVGTWCTFNSSSTTLFSSTSLLTLAPRAVLLVPGFLFSSTDAIDTYPDTSISPYSTPTESVQARVLVANKIDLLFGYSSRFGDNKHTGLAAYGKASPGGGPSSAAVRAISEAEGRRYAAEMEALYFEVSALKEQSSAVEDLFRTAAHVVREVRATQAQERSSCSVC